MVAKSGNSNPEKKKVLRIAPLFDLGVDFGVDTKIWVFWTRVFILRYISRQVVNYVGGPLSLHQQYSGQGQKSLNEPLLVLGFMD
jgi:hypothetical protein